MIELQRHSFKVVTVRAGGAGLYAALEASPRGIWVTKHINPTKRLITEFRTSRGEKARVR